jgi:hypothetical protein
VRGRLQADFPIVDANRGEYDQPQMRRIRIGARTRWLANLVLHVEIDLDGTCENDDRCPTELVDATAGDDRFSSHWALYPGSQTP